MPNGLGMKRKCTLLLFVATPAEEDALEQTVKDRFGLPYERIVDDLLGEYHWIGDIGNETVMAIRPARDRGQVVMGQIGRLGSAARGIRFRDVTGASGIVQLGMGFGIDPHKQNLGDVLVSTSLIPYDNRLIGTSSPQPSGALYSTDYSPAVRQPARPALVDLFRRAQRRDGSRKFEVHFGAILSAAARIHSRHFRDELIVGVPGGDDDIVGGEMEGVGLLAATTLADDPVWCVVKGISDFADENRGDVIDASRPIACRNAAEFVLAALVNNVNA